MEPGIVLKGWKQTLPITTKITQLWTDSNNRLWKEKKKNSYRTYLRDLRCMLEYFFYKARNFCFAIQSYCPDITSTKHDPAHREREGIRIRNRNHFCFNFLSVQKQHWAWKRSSVLLMETSFYRTVARQKNKSTHHTHTAKCLVSLRRAASNGWSNTKADNGAKCGLLIHWILLSCPYPGHKDVSQRCDWPDLPE